MKPSERRALEAEKRAQKEAEARERELERKQQKNEADVSDAEQNVVVEMSGTQKHGSEPYKRKEGFFQSHIRLITFIVTATLLLTVLGPLGIDMLVESRNDKIVDNKEDISIDTVYAVYDNYSQIKWGSFKNFNYTDYSDSVDGITVYEREYPVSNSRLVLKIGGSSLSDRPEYIYLIDYRMGERVDLAKEDPRDYVKTME